jgi:hypothetical protein
MSASRYPYAEGDYLTLRPAYTYCDCADADFPLAWRAVREKALDELSRTPPPAHATARAAPPRPLGPDEIAIDALLDRLTASLAGADAITPATERDIARLIQRFEAGKRLYAVYSGPELRGQVDTDFRDLSRYVRFGEILIDIYRRRGLLPALNALLKLGDLLCAEASAIPAPWRQRAREVLINEAAAVRKLAETREVPWPA